MITQGRNRQAKLLMFAHGQELRQLIYLDLEYYFKELEHNSLLQTNKNISHI